MILSKPLHLLSPHVLTCKMGGPPGGPVSEAAVGNSSSSLVGKICEEYRVV